MQALQANDGSACPRPRGPGRPALLRSVSTCSRLLAGSAVKSACLSCQISNSALLDSPPSKFALFCGGFANQSRTLSNRQACFFVYSPMISASRPCLRQTAQALSRRVTLKTSGLVPNPGGCAPSTTNVWNLNRPLRRTTPPLKALLLLFPGPIISPVIKQEVRRRTTYPAPGPHPSGVAGSLE